jgi:hypothetical protein
MIGPRLRATRDSTGSDAISNGWTWSPVPISGDNDLSSGGNADLRVRHAILAIKVLPGGEATPPDVASGGGLDDPSIGDLA